MLADAKRGLFKFAMQKIGPSRRLEWALEIVKIFQNAGVTLRSVEQKFDLDTPDGKLLFAMLGSLGQFFSDNLSQETGKGKLERATQGYHNNQVPWGYKSELVVSRASCLLTPTPKKS